MICTFRNLKLEVVQGDIASQEDLDVVVNAANARLASGGGVAGAIHKAAGPALYKACKILAPLKPGEAVVTPAFNLPNKFIIHCLGPVYGQDHPEDVLLANSYKNALKLADQNELRAIGFTAILTGIFGYPSELAVAIVFNTVLAEAALLKHVKRIKFVLFSDKELLLYESKLKQIITD